MTGVTAQHTLALGITTSGGVMGTGRDLWNEWETLHNKHDWAGLASFFTPDAVYVYPFGRREGPEAISVYFAGMGKAFPDINLDTSQVIDDGDIVMAEWMSRITHTRPFTMPNGRQIAATGKMLEIAGVIVARVRDGKFATMRDYYDTADLMRQISG